MLPDKMAISHSNHLFVPVAFVFCLLSPLVHTSDSYDYTDSRQFEKNPAVSKHRNNVQRLPNYNWKPPDKYYGPRKEESTEKNPGMEFTKPEDPEQRMADSWIKKMQEISRQEREKWAAYRRNVKLALDNIEEPTKAGKLTNDESITIPSLSENEEYDEYMEDESELSTKLSEESESLETSVEIEPVTSKTFVRHSSSVDQNNADMKDDSSDNRLHDFSWLISKQSADINIDEKSNEKLKRDEWSINGSSEKFRRKAPIRISHRRYRDYEISDIMGNSSFTQNTATKYNKNEHEKNRSDSTINSDESGSQQFKDLPISKNGIRIHENFKTSLNKKNNEKLNQTNSSRKSFEKKYSSQFNTSQDKENNKDNKENEETTTNLLMQTSKKNDVNSHLKKSILRLKVPHILENSANKNHRNFSKIRKNLNDKIDSEELYTTEYLKQSPSQNKNEKNDKKDGEIIMARSLKSKEEKGGKDATEKLNHETSFHSGRWGTSVSSPPVDFLKDISQGSKHRKDGKQAESKEDGNTLFGRCMSVALPPKELFEDISMHQEHGTKPSLTAKAGSGSMEIGGGSSDDRSPIHQSRRNLQATLVERPMTDERYKELGSETLFEKVPDSPYNSKYPNLSYWNNYSRNIDFNNSLLLRLIMQMLRPRVCQDDMDISISCRMRIPNAPPLI